MPASTPTPPRQTPPKGAKPDAARPRPTPRKDIVFTDWASI